MAVFQSKVCVITGAGSGIGRALAIELAERGARLAISDVDEAGLTQTAGAALARGAEVERYLLDVSVKADMFAHAEVVAERFGAVNLLVNNAGVALDGTFADTPVEDFEWLMGINFWGVVYGSKAFLPKLIASGDGHLVNVSSILGMIASPDLTAYCAAKFAVRGFTESLREELLVARAPVRVSCVHPGGVKTGIARSARSATRTPDELAKEFARIAFTTPETAAATILSGVAKGRPRIFVGADARLLELSERVLGARYQRVVALAAGRLGRQ